jgi:hypothetical protein
MEHRGGLGFDPSASAVVNAGYILVPRVAVFGADLSILPVNKVIGIP